MGNVPFWMWEGVPYCVPQVASLHTTGCEQHGLSASNSHITHRIGHPGEIPGRGSLILSAARQKTL